MPCRSRLSAYYKPGGGITFKRAETFGPAWAYDVNCGVCRDCRIRRARNWAIRCTHESTMHTHNTWVTPTYARDPISLNRRDFQLFFKQLRNFGHKFSYFGCGEYGKKLSRPHGHICLFGIDFKDKKPWKKSGKELLYRSKDLEKAWPHGHILIGNLTPQSAIYTAGYIQKKITGDEAEHHYVRDIEGIPMSVSPEFSMASRNPAIGLSWIKEHYAEVYPADSVIMNGREYHPPPYYDAWLAENHPTTWEDVRSKRLEFSQNQTKPNQKRAAQAAYARDLRHNQKERRYENSEN